MTMSMNDAKTLTSIKAHPIRARVSFALAVGEMVLLELAEDPQGLGVARDALRLSWLWVSGKPVKGEEIEEYVSSHTDKHLTRYELRNQKEEMRAAIIAIASAVAFAGREAYQIEGLTEEMSQSMADVTDDELFDQLLNCAKKTSRYDAEVLQRMNQFLSERYAGQGPETLGGPITVDEVLPLISAVPGRRG